MKRLIAIACGLTAVAATGEARLGGCAEAGLGGLKEGVAKAPERFRDYTPGTYANVREKAANTLKYAYSPNRLFERIAAGEMAVGGYVGSLDPQQCEMAGFAGLDFVWIDMEHRPMTVKDILAMQMALEGTGCASLVRVRSEEFSHVKPIVDIGVDGIIFPQVSGHAAAVRAVEACRYPQAGGRRGVCIDRQSGYGKLSLRDYLKRCETWPLVIIELEDLAGISELDRILALKDVDAIMVGPADLACSMGALRLQGDASVQRLVDDVAARTRKAGKLFFSLGSLETARARGSAFYCGEGNDAASWREMHARATAGTRPPGGEPKIAVFAGFIRRIAAERGVPKAEAARLLHDLGVRGFDAGPEDRDLDELAATCLKPVSFCYFPDWFGRREGALSPEACLEKAVRMGVTRVVAVPPDFTDGVENAAEFARILAHLRDFVAAAKARGVAVTVEDFGGTANCCSHAKYLKRLLDEIPDLMFALDSGNLRQAGRGEDILEVLAHAGKRVAHVRLKDAPADGRAPVTLGLGAVPNARIVKEVAASGYDGWYALEGPAGDAYDDAVRQVALLKSWLRAAPAGLVARDGKANRD